jgi:hypothetical protein
MAPSRGRLLRQSRRLPAAALILVLLTALPASANGAMSLALATFAWGPWLTYVAATVLFEGALLGRWLRLPFPRALRTSLIANGVTCILGTVFCCSGLLGYVLLGVFGSPLDPNPLGHTLVSFFVFGAASAYTEAWFWRESLPADSPTLRSQVAKRSLAVHLLGIPIGLGILLAPERPYVGLESTVAGMRRRDDRKLLRALQEYVMDHEALPPDRTFEAVLERLAPRSPGDRRFRGPGWTIAYEPEYHRFDTHEMRRNPIEWNAALAGAPLGKGPERTTWLCRSRTHDFVWGWLVSLPEGRLERTLDAVELGYSGP